MPRLSDARTQRRATLLLSLALILYPLAANAERAETSIGSTAAHDRRQLPGSRDQAQDSGQQRPVAQELPGAQAQQEREQDPDERAARGEFPETGEDTVSIGGATLLLTPSTLVTTPGRPVRLTLSILGAEDLRRLPVTLRFDPAVLEVVSVSLGSAYKGRQQPVLLHDASRPGELVVGLGQLDRNATGVFGAAELLELEFRTLASGNAEIVLERFAAIGGGSKPHRIVALTARVIVQ